MPPTALRAAEGHRHFIVQLRKSRDVGDVSSPEWAQAIARDVVDDAKVRLARLGTDSVVESVMIPKDAANDSDEAAELAEEIAGRVES